MLSGPVNRECYRTQPSGDQGAACGGEGGLLKVVRGFKGANGEAPSYVADLVARVTPLLAEATQSWDGVSRTWRRSAS